MLCGSGFIAKRTNAAHCAPGMSCEYSPRQASCSGMKAWNIASMSSSLGGLPCVLTTPPTPCPGDYQFGFRVPLLVVSAYTPKGFIHNGVDDYGSILRMIEDPGRATAMARTGRKRVEAEFSVTAKIDRTEALYRRLLETKRPA